MNIWLISHALIHNEHGQVLIIQRSKDNDVLSSTWDIPGGSCEPGEDPVEAAIRETKEETSLIISDLKLFVHTSNVDIQKNTQFVRMIFMAKYNSGDIQLNAREHETFAWVDPTNPDKEPLVEYLPMVFKKFLGLRRHEA